MRIKFQNILGQKTAINPVNKKCFNEILDSITFSATDRLFRSTAWPEVIHYRA